MHDAPAIHPLKVVGTPGARVLFVMAKKPSPAPTQPAKARLRGPWPSVLVEMAAAGRADGGLGLHDLLKEAGFGQKPAMTIIIKRSRSVDPQVDDVLDALRALCA